MFGNILSLPDPESLFPTHLHSVPMHPEAKPTQCRHIWRYLWGHIPKSGNIFTGGCIQKWIDPAGSRRASRFCDSTISWTGARGSFSLTPFIHPKVVEKNALNFEGIETRSILSRLHRSVQSVRLTPLPLVSMLTRFCVGV